MRIRKRKVPLPLSLLSPIPITDAHLFSRSSVTLVQPTQDQTTQTSNVPANQAQPSDHFTTFDLRRPIDDGNSSNDQHHDCLRFKGVESVPKSNDAGNKSITTLGGAAGACSINAPLPLSLNHQEKMGWCDEDKAMPLKKRRGSLDSTETTDVVDSTSKSLENYVEKCDVDKEELKGSYESNNNGVNGKKSSKRGKTIMEGSRCSRVNGRGWRCCQPTLVGYSLCEHHLGKGRLRNMSNVRGRTSPMSSKKAALGTSSETLGNSSEKMKKRAKIGVVKARSLSSLLGQTVDTSSSNDSSSIAATLDQYGKEII